MIKFLQRDILKLSAVLALFTYDVRAMDIVNITETPDELLIESKVKYPKKVFEAEEFIQEVGNKLGNKTAVELDLSNDDSVNYMDLRKILSFFNKRDVKVNYLNLSNTDTDGGIFTDYDSLTSNPNFKYLDISKTPAVETEEDFSKKDKIIFIGKNMLENSRSKLEKAFGKEVIDRHTRYYEAKSSVTKERETSTSLFKARP